ncbi:MAG TPA: HAMP domain-containing sensor histidine kinase [Coleofasciculaceae cyanobacterium]
MNSLLTDLTKLRPHLRSRLLLSHLLVVALSIGSFALVGWLSSPKTFVWKLDELEVRGWRLRYARTQLVNSFGFVLQQSTLWSGLVGAVAAGGFSYWAALRIARPLKQMEEVTLRFAAGELDARIQASDIPELNQLGSSFNRLAASLEGTEQRRRDLISDLTHELRTPLTVVRGYLEELSEGRIEPSPDLFDRLIRETKRLERLVNDTQELSRAETGYLPINVQAIELRPLLGSIISRIADQVFDDEPQLILDCPAGLPLVNADPDRVEQVLLNLMGNALRHTPTGSITLWAALRDERSMWVGVTDTGEGISPEDLPHIFERFWRGDRSRSRHDGRQATGAGIGLSISRRLVELQGGEMDVASELGKGSTFRFSLPLTLRGEGLF